MRDWRRCGGKVRRMPPVIFRVIIFAVALGVLYPAAADDRHLPGRSHLGPAFDRGPRQRAYLMGGTGKVHFPVTAKDPLVQKYIEQGIGQLHGFWYREAERSFREAARLDPDCAIAYWGMSLANERDPGRARQFALEALKHRAGASERERMYIDALVNRTSYRPIVEKFRDDLEAKAFDVWRIWNLSESGPISAAEKAAAMALAHEILRVDPNHPIHHAVIHMADAAEKYASALESAARCGPSAPSIGHMWHMPTHIYYGLRRYAEAAWQLEASMRTEHARMMHDRTLPDQVHLYAHNCEWLSRTLLHVGRPRVAQRVALQMIDLPRHPLWNILEPPSGESSSEESAGERPREAHGSSAYFGRERLLQILRRFEYWDDLIEVCRSGTVELTRLPAEQGKVHVALGVAFYCRGDVAAGDSELAQVRELLDDQRAQQRAALAEANQRPERQRVGARNAVHKRFKGTIAGLELNVRELQSYREIVTGVFVSRTMLAIGLAAIFAAQAFLLWRLRRRLIPAALLGVVGIALAVWLFVRHLALLNLPENSTNVDFAFVTRRQLEAGAPDAAVSFARRFASERYNQVRPLANLVEALYLAGYKDEARVEFERLRELAGTAELDAPPLARLGPIAAEFGWPADWRRPEAIRQALSGRPPLESLGPFLWRPWQAPEWKLTDAAGREHHLTEFRGKPVLMLFFLGRGCLHCKQQLEAFVKKEAGCAKQGIAVIAVSTDDRGGVGKSLADYKPGPFPYLMLADPRLEAFRAYGAYDDFEKMALHGTFLIDADGLVRWQDVSFEPFMDPGFVLTESKRLLARPVAPVEADARVIAGR